MDLNMNSGLQQNFVWFLENKTKDKDLSRRLCCEKCRFSTKDVELFERHVAHHEEVTFSCTLCNHVSYSRVESQRHIVTHKGSYPYKCNWCPYGAVRRDYMVKHIQRIHGKPANGSFTTDCTVSSAKLEHSSQQQTIDPCPDTPGTLGEPVQNVKFVSDSTGNVFSLLPGGNQNQVTAPYLVVRPVQQATNNGTHLICSTAAQAVTSTTCILPVTKTQPHSVYSTSQSVSKVTHVIGSPLNIMVNKVDQRCTGKTSLENSSYSNTLPRVHVSVPTDCTIQPKALLQSQVGVTAESIVIQSKTVAKNQVLSISGNCSIQQQPLTQNQVRGTTEKIQPKTGPKNQVGVPVGDNIYLKTLLSKPVESSGQKPVEVQNVTVSPPGQKPVNSGSGRNISVPPAVQRSVPSGVHYSKALGQFGQGALSFSFGTPNSEKNKQRKTRPNILAKKPAEKPESKKQPSVQVELLAPLNQPIQHNRPLTVSCPEEITIPAGCLVELVEVKNVNGTKELELRLVPQQSSALPPGGSRNTSGASAASGLSLKCKFATDDSQPTKCNLSTSSSQKDAIHEHLKEHSADVKGDPEINERVLCSKMNATQTPGSSSGAFCGMSRLVSRPSEAHRFINQTSTAYRNVANSTETLPIRQMHCRGKTTIQSTMNTNVTVKGLAETSPIKHEDVESSYQGFPVISSVFSLQQSSPEATLSGIHPKVGILDARMVAQTLTKDESTVKTEEETMSLTENMKNSVQKLEQNDRLLEHSEVLDATVPEKMDDVGNGSNLKGKIMPEVCSFLKETLETATADSSQKITISPLSNSISTHEENERMKKSSLPAESCSPFPLAMNPTVALARIPSLDFYSFVESEKKVSEKASGEESITARPVLCCTLNQQNVQERAIKLVLKRKRSESEHKDSAQDSQSALATFVIQPPHKKRKKEKKRAKKHKSSKVMMKIHQIMEKGVGKLWFTPLKEDQLVKCPAPNQPVVVLNHPNPFFQMAHVQTLKDYQWIASAHSPQTHEDMSAKLLNQCPSFKMTLKKVQGQEYQVTELVLKGVSEKVIL